MKIHTELNPGINERQAADHSLRQRPPHPRPQKIDSEKAKLDINAVSQTEMKMRTVEKKLKTLQTLYTQTQMQQQKKSISPLATTAPPPAIIENRNPMHDNESAGISGSENRNSLPVQEGRDLVVQINRLQNELENLTASLTVHRISPVLMQSHLEQLSKQVLKKIDGKQVNQLIRP